MSLLLISLAIKRRTSNSRRVSLSLSLRCDGLRSFPNGTWSLPSFGICCDQRGVFVVCVADWRALDRTAPRIAITLRTRSLTSPVPETAGISISRAKSSTLGTWSAHSAAHEGSPVVASDRRLRNPEDSPWSGMASYFGLSFSARQPRTSAVKIEPSGPRAIWCGSKCGLVP